MSHRPTSVRRLALPAIVLAAAALAGCDKKSADPEATAHAIQPVARVELKVEKIAPGSRTGEQVYQAICTSCHAAGALGAPKTGDKATWAPRLAKGMDALVASVENGLGAMPPKGGGSDLTDKEIARAVAYLANQAGASFTEPPLE